MEKLCFSNCRSRLNGTFEHFEAAEARFVDKYKLKNRQGLSQIPSKGGMRLL